MYKVNVDQLNTPDSVLGLSVNNDDYSVMHPTITENGERMYFASDMPGGLVVWIYIIVKYMVYINSF